MILRRTFKGIPSMSRGGKREGAGWPKGALTKKTRLIAEQAMAEGITPLEMMVKAMRHALSEAYKEDGGIDFDMLKAAADLAAMSAPYVHPRLSASKQEHSGSLTLERLITDSMSIDDQRALVAALDAIEADKSELH
jgi:hypothetical protein